MIEVRIHEDVYAQLKNHVLCALHTLRVLREAGVPTVGNLALVGVETGTLQTWRDTEGLDGDEYVFLYSANGKPPSDRHVFRFHEDGLLETADPFGFANFVERMSRVVPLNSRLSPHAVADGVLTLYRDETLDGDDYVFSWLPFEL